MDREYPRGIGVDTPYPGDFLSERKKMGVVEELQKMGFKVLAFTEYHFRVNDEFDFWLPRGKWHDLVTGDRGRKPLDQIPFFVKDRLGRPLESRATEEDFTNFLHRVGYTKEEADKAWKERTSKALS